MNIRGFIMLDVGDIVVFKDADAWPGFHYGIIAYKLRNTPGMSGMVSVRFETDMESVYHFDVPVLEKWLRKVG